MEITNKPTPQQIAAWKTEHGEVTRFSAHGYECWLRKPKRKDLSQALLAQRKDPLDFAESLANNCWLAGDPEMLTNDDAYLSLAGEMDDLYQIGKCDVVKL